MTIIAEKHIPSVDWSKWMQSFSAGVTNKTYDKMDYQLWKKCNRTGEAVNVTLTDLPSIRLTIGDRPIEFFGIRDESFGTFLFNNMFNKEERTMATCSNITSTSVSDSVCAAGKATINVDTTNYLDFSNQYNSASTASAIIPGTDEIYTYYAHDLSNTVEAIEDLEHRINNLESKNNERENKNMKGFNFDFGPCTNDQCHMSMYGIAIRNAAGTYVSYNPNSNEIVDVDILNFDGAKFMYKLPVAINAVAIGDVIIHNRKPMFVVGLPTENNNTFICVDVYAGEQKQIIPTVNMFGFNFITKIVSLFNAIGDNAPSPDQPFGNMLPFLMLGDDNKNIDPMVMFLMMNQSGNGTMIPVMWYSMFKDNKDIDPAMMWMIMSMASGAAPAFMTGNYNKATITPETQA